MRNRSRLESVLAIAAVWAVGCTTAATSDPASPEQARLAEQRVEIVELPPSASSDTGSAVIEERVRFAAGSSELDAPAIATLTRFVERLQAEPGDYRIELRRPTSGPRDERGRGLSEARAAAVRRFLHEAGVLTDRTSVVAEDQRRPGGAAAAGRPASASQVRIIATLLPTQAPDHF